MAVKLIAIDMDGTLLNPQHQVSAGVNAAISAAKAKGIKVVLATGRPYVGIVRYLKELDLQQDDQYAISYNGALVHRAVDGEPVSEVSLGFDDYLYFEKLARQLGVHFQALDKTALYTANKDISEYTVHEAYLTGIALRYCPRDEMDPHTTFPKVMMIDKPALLDAAIAALPQAAWDKYTLLKSAPYYLEILNKRVNKGYGVKVLADLLGLKPEEIMAIGDQENDIAMIQYAGTGVAMGNAIEPVKAAAQFVTRSNSEDGVAYAIERFAL
ncbi:sugar-phosphatase [Erwinia sp. OLTSP20]|uniref:sugar-phosphatase n=1 Tax=unclassified Erwinia TaxID=2622719 RepID=UPI000C1A4038|nr:MULTISPECIES: sugar-phosphatase [unclassified Erwinia]PIJ49557.1 sugar-phosphatase [Erwinia sp. OAMSP11]PIJ72312.1 sugar-phosphatase [Erwinia sp. OLSSP12]PIJ81623.1 sugar-phosphatase [Erwinia sp. OLMDSP33]PIJ81671.1 sugar-phosphatase [Erwinia sp. OLCASP19]PIJ91100.1 sugar-phosphatase [Erwinia sp. OLTSP20]